MLIIFIITLSGCASTKKAEKQQSIDECLDKHLSTSKYIDEKTSEEVADILADCVMSFK